MARLARAQHVAATTLRPFPGPQQITVESAVEARMPPLAADGHRRDPAWREGLAMLLDTFDGRAITAACAGRGGEPARAGCGCGGSAGRRISASRRGRRRCGRRAVCGGGFAGVFHPGGGGFAGRLPAVAAAARAVPLLRLDAGVGRGDRVGPKRLERAICIARCARRRGTMCAPCASPAVRRAHCRWRGSRATPARPGPRPATLCHTYAKMLYQARDTQVDPFADDLATLGLDLLVAEAGWARHAPNPLLLIASGA